MIYQTPKVEILILDQTDVIATSGDQPLHRVTNGGAGGHDQVVNFGNLNFQ